MTCPARQQCCAFVDTFLDQRLDAIPLTLRNDRSHVNVCLRIAEGDGWITCLAMFLAVSTLENGTSIPVGA